MKKMICVLLCFVLLALSAVPAFAAVDPWRTGSPIPIVFLAGDGEPIYDDQDNVILKISESGLLGLFTGKATEKEDEGDGDSLYSSIANVMMPFLIEGLMSDNWEPYYENLEKEIGDLFATGRLDNNGNAPAGTGISSARRRQNEENRHWDKKAGANGYDFYHYQFWYDWRLDPLEIAEQLHEYIEDVKKATKKDKVALASACLGTNVVLAYLSRYDASDLAGVGMIASLAKGSEFLSQAISGRFHIDMEGLNRILTDTDAIDRFDMPAFATATIDLLSKSGMFGALTDSFKKKIYAKVVEGVTSAIAMSTIFTMPCYWGCVADEDYDNALQYVFGPEGSEKRIKYAGLIEKIDNYHNQVAKEADNLLLGLKKSNVNLAILCKYGFQMVPICEESNLISDQYVSVNKASFGATTSTIFDTLSDDYIAGQEAAELGKYISPDKQVDASTCLFPDCTWFTKDSPHTLRTDAEVRIMYSVITADHQMTPEDFTYGRFLVYNNDTKEMAPMTTENCHTEHWTQDEMKQPSADKKTTVFNGLISFFKWLIELFKLLRPKLGI